MTVPTGDHDDAGIVLCAEPRSIVDAVSRLRSLTDPLDDEEVNGRQRQHRRLQWTAADALRRNIYPVIDTATSLAAGYRTQRRRKPTRDGAVFPPVRIREAEPFQEWLTAVYVTSENVLRGLG